MIIRIKKFEDCFEISSFVNEADKTPFYIIILSMSEEYKMPKILADLYYNFTYHNSI